MGVDSGLPDFCGNEGFLKAYPALEKSKLSFAEMADPTWFYNNPRLAWGFYGHRLNLYRERRPHLGFSILQKWTKKMIRGVAVFTSNVDGEFQKKISAELFKQSAVFFVMHATKSYRTQ